MQTGLFFRLYLEAIVKHYQSFQLHALLPLLLPLFTSLGRVILWCDKLCIVLVWYLKNNLCINPHQSVKATVNIVEHRSHHVN